MSIKQLNGRSTKAKRRIGFTLNLYMILIVTTPLILIFTLLVFIVSERLIDQNRQQITSVTELKFFQIQDFLADSTATLQLVLVWQTVAPALFENSGFGTAVDQITDTLIQQLDQQPFYENFFVYDLDGFITISTDNRLGVADVIRSQPYFRPSLRSEGVQPLYIDSETGEFILMNTVPITLGTENVIAIAAGELSIAALSNIVSTDVGLGDTGEAYLVSTQDFLVLGDTSNFPRRRSFGIEEAINGNSGWAMYENYRGEQVLGVYQWIPELQVALVVEVSQTEVFASLAPLIQTGLVLLLGIITLTIIIGNRFARRIVYPIENLTQIATQLAAGNFVARAEIYGNDEIAVMANAFNTMADHLQGLITNLEDRVNERTRDITLAAQVSQQITTELDSSKLLGDVTALTAQTFNLYHVSVFLFDEIKNQLYLDQGVGNVGLQMLAQNKHFHLDDAGLVPEAARTRQHKLSNNVIQDSTHIQNPLLPNTRSELAIPMLYRNKLIGVLDLQSENVDHFRPEDVHIMTTLAEQIAIAVQNAQLFDAIQDALREAERANEVKSQFLSSMSHELRTPLNAIINFTKFLLKGKMGPVNERQVDALDKVKESGIHLLNLINDVLDISKIESGSLSLLVETDVDVAELIQKAEATVHILLADKPVTLDVEIEDMLPHIVCDKQRVLQILLNILSNACKFTEEGKIRIRAYTQDANIAISVIDTGPGIPVEQQDDVFMTFKQTEAGLRKGGGTGLGMPISRHLAKAHGGDLVLESVVGQGSTFTVMLPIQSEILEPNMN